MELYLSDLDGTLLDTTGRLSKKTKVILEKLMYHGLAFTVASGRTPLSAMQLLKELPLRYPMILMNGAAIISPSGLIMESTPFAQESCDTLREYAKKADVEGLLVYQHGNLCISAFSQNPSPIWRKFLQRTQLADSEILIGEPPKESQLLYAIYIDTKPEKLAALRDSLENLDGFAQDYYQDSYSADWFLEIYSRKASKYHAAMRLRSLTGADRMIAFGDSLNDLPLFDACDECYAVDNARQEVRAAANQVVASNAADGVARFLTYRGKEFEYAVSDM